MRGKEYAVVATGVRQGRPAPLRLTRRGRAVVFALFLAAWTAASAVLWATASRAEESPVPGVTVVVRPGDSLWSIAEREAPGRATGDVVAGIVRLNDVDGSLIHPGESLVLPR